MKGYCPKCGGIVDEVEYQQLGMCEDCYKNIDFIKKFLFDLCSAKTREDLIEKWEKRLKE